ncbi:peptidase domain-containing ABC transporter [Mucilaginibacter rubeus]|uniref:Peptidase domain-containing ABC transporter n=1 Tax=Mucilaginibacter rubeus TaxID=2027860 RepID=A0AAE6MHA6_9SPHI|nr:MULTISPECIES: peptidase domain-containing ABC transporter [Mucilaginibacter]QEM03064.1 peptidase domain-containing ABC transporter [Mucilaginibacter rubeus]QEM15684.1 peptidase domain-containing ABC transporter [Mucilaginibacter gossypii]QTE41581.1 peptidase domain-containing ABC transporter [Mucilaginibacter rubeus]QTE48187.1 peptidase domain-containing ABC transporter [Mucilaginibacter rubeus]QTE59577.1 peptidase domain-containing ABC transporter [Mucilaginibacter rubeus]
MNKFVKIKQKDTTDCGAACLTAIAKFYGTELTISRVRQYAGTDKFGTNILGIIEAAERLGFQAKGAKGKIENLLNVPLPAIAHVILESGLHHYVVLYQVKNNKFTYLDPIDGLLHKATLENFNSLWTGNIVLLLPNAEFINDQKKISALRRFGQLIKPHKWIMIQALVGAIVYTILGLASAVYVQKIIDYVLVDNNQRLLNILSIGMICILISQAIVGLMRSVLTIKTGQFIDAQLILGYYKHLMRLPQRFFDTMKIGEIISRVNDAVKIRVFVNEVASNIIVNFMILIFSFIIMFLYSWKLALVVTCIIPFYILIYQISNSVNKKWQRILMENTASLESQLVESLNSIGTIKKFGIEDYANLTTETRFIPLIKAIFKSGIKGLYLLTSAEFITKAFTIIVLWCGSYFVINQQMSPGELLSFYALINYFTGPASSLIVANKNIQDALIATERLFEIIDLEVEETEVDKISLNPSLLGTIEFKDVYFNYSNRSTIFNGLSFKIKKNEMTAIVGESGSGKSTIAALLLKVYPLTGGSISIGERDIKYYSNSSLRQIISIVPQQIDLFNSSIIDNIALGDIAPDLNKIIILCQKLGLNDFIEKLPNTYYTIVSENGVNLSGGQKQRIAVARALYKNPEILILDEATAALDVISERLLIETLSWFKSMNKTVIIIAHRLSTIRDCDQILVLNNGKLADCGNHQLLIDRNDLYANLWKEYAGNLQ